MKREQEMLREFHAAASQPMPGKPEIPSPRIQKLRLYLHLEEAVTELSEAFEKGDIVEVADAIGDSLYVLLGTAVTCGIDIEPIFHAIHRSNMTKFIDGHVRESDGKWIKGPSYTPVNLKPIIEQQLHEH